MTGLPLYFFNLWYNIKRVIRKVKIVMVVGFGIVIVILGVVLIAIVLAGVFGTRRSKNSKEDDSGKLL